MKITGKIIILMVILLSNAPLGCFANTSESQSTKPMSLQWNNWKVTPTQNKKKTVAFPAIAPKKVPVTTLKGQISETLFLPQAMYGTWSIRATVVQSDAPLGEFQSVTNEIWTLARENDKVTIENIVTNAKASIHVEKVEDNIATFHHESESSDGSFAIYETPTVAVRKDSLIGSNDQVYVFYRNGREVERYHLKVNITGSRLAKQTRKFGPELEPNIEVEPLQKETAY